MKDEIKEILKQCDGVVKREIPLLILAPEYTQLLLDYITNLQDRIKQYEDPEDLTLFYMWLDEKAKDKLTNLQEENEYSDYCNKKLREKITNLEYKITTLEDYKTRNEKAIEYIEKEYGLVQYEAANKMLKDLLNILQNGEENE